MLNKKSNWHTSVHPPNIPTTVGLVRRLLTHSDAISNKNCTGEYEASQVISNPYSWTAEQYLARLTNAKGTVFKSWSWNRLSQCNESILKWTHDCSFPDIFTVIITSHSNLLAYNFCNCKTKNCRIQSVPGSERIKTGTSSSPPPSAEMQMYCC
jgi:hypothetical protein